MPLADELAKALAGHPEVRLAMLFGSRARGRAQPSSDVDLAVEGDDLDILALASELALHLGLEIDLVELDRASYPLLKALLRDAIVVHEGVRGAAASWRAQAIGRVELDRPWFERMRDGFLCRLAEPTTNQGSPQEPSDGRH